MGETEKLGIDLETQEKEYGRNIRQKAFYFRHGEKAGEELAPKGFEQAEEAGQAIKNNLDFGEVDFIKPYSSELKRAQDMAETIVNATEKTESGKLRIKSGLGSNEFWGKEYWARYEEFKKEHGADINKWVEWLISEGDKKIGKYSTTDVGMSFARHILWQAKMPEKYKSGSNVELVNGTHTGCIEPGLSVLIGEQVENDPVNPNGKSFLEKLGGTFKTAESFEVDTDIDENGNKNVILKLRGKEYPLDIDKLSQKVEEYFKENKID